MQNKWNFSTEELQQILRISEYNFDNMPFKGNTFRVIWVANF